LEDEELRRLERWLRFDSTKNVFPREVGYREVVRNFDDFVGWYETYRYEDYCWSSVYSTDQMSKSSFDTLFLDFDMKKGDGLYSVSLMLKPLINALVDMFPRVRLYWSGVKGFHIYLDFGKEVFFYNFREAARKFVKDFVANYLEPDMHAVGDIRRMARIVGNIRRQGSEMKRMIELCCYDDVVDWMKHIGENKDADCACLDEIDMDKDRGLNMLISADEQYAEKVVAVVEERLLSKQSLDKIPPCVVRCFTELVETGELDHGGRVLLANWLLWAGYSVEEVIDVFRVANDFKEHYTRYQVEFINRKKYKLPSCKKIMAEGYCPYKCELYPWMQGSR